MKKLIVVIFSLNFLAVIGCGDSSRGKDVTMCPKEVGHDLLDWSQKASRFTQIPRTREELNKFIINLAIVVNGCHNLVQKHSKYDGCEMQDGKFRINLIDEQCKKMEEALINLKNKSQ